MSSYYLLIHEAELAYPHGTYSCIPAAWPHSQVQLLDLVTNSGFFCVVLHGMRIFDTANTILAELQHDSTPSRHWVKRAVPSTKYLVRRAGSGFLLSGSILFIESALVQQYSHRRNFDNSWRLLSQRRLHDNHYCNFGAHKPQIKMKSSWPTCCWDQTNLLKTSLFTTIRRCEWPWWAHVRNCHVINLIYL